MKSYTDLEQSKKLAEILPLESADMHYILIDTDEDKYDTGLGKYIGILPHYPCWSLAALLNSIPHYTLHSPNPLSEKYCCICVEYEIETYGDTQLDAVFQMIIWLKENNKL